MDSDVPTIEPTITRSPNDFAASRQASASVSPPALSSLMLTALYRSQSSLRPARVCTLSSRANGNARTESFKTLSQTTVRIGRKGLFHHLDARCNGNIKKLGGAVLIPGLIGIQKETRIRPGRTHCLDALTIVQPAKLQLQHLVVAMPLCLRGHVVRRTQAERDGRLDGGQGGGKRPIGGAFPAAAPPLRFKIPECTVQAIPGRACRHFTLQQFPVEAGPPPESAHG